MNPTTDYLPQLLQQLQAATTPEQSIDLLIEAADAHPNDARPMLLLGAEFMERRDVDRAEAAYVAALQRAPDFAIARFQLGLLQFSSGRPAVASASWAPLGGLAEQDPLRLFKEGLERLAVDDFEGARSLIERGIAANTSNPPLNRDMHMLLDRMRTTVPGKAADAPAQAGTEDESAQAHFLISAYKSPD